mmetsp:Transcript_10927/g.20412  ORF Transcript_10927/g.20412 Transcript_10927/m.20412 type:complete len:560 (+) Transcript_10927:151-1830(+)|eukprot:CAMPEP_0176481416 /NCGR_PEP_ID=MMETSP0200_2-20121128/2807_1 /TAXON_ID=947934 /ORGANISM="Chaetoceros sp., Strain GSL56" /LENGTH=559 /DNA_ID=CAMNT_0017877617 /DNA_START=203 /DNA_END=1882 /DNA_ORIENTATION=+
MRANSNVIYQLILERNALETDSFVEVYDALFELRSRYNNLETECYHQQNDLAKLLKEVNERGATKTELRLQEKIHALERKIQDKESQEKEMKRQVIQVTEKLSKQSELDKQREKRIQSLEQELTQKETVVDRLTNELSETTNNLRLAEKQYDGLKDTIERLQEEKDGLSKSNDELVSRIVTEKEKYMEQMNEMTKLYEQANQKLEMLRKLHEQEKKRFMWTSKPSSSSKTDNQSHDISESTVQNGRLFGGLGILLPSEIKHKIAAHLCQATSVRYDASGGDIIATASEDSSVKLWNTGTGNLFRTFRSTGHQVMLGVDLSGDLVVGCGTDKMCRVWNARNQRLVHQLVGHSQKVTSARLFKGNSSAVLTASSDRSMKVWDITRHTYRQTVTLKHGSTPLCLDMSYDGVSALSGHLDGGIRFWDVRSGERTAEVSNLHSEIVTSVSFNPNNNVEVISMGRDNCIKVVDVRNAGKELHRLDHVGFQIDVNHAACVISQDGKYVAAGSSNGQIFIWKMIDGQIEKQLKAHDTGVVAVAWDRGGSNGQQFASIDKAGNLFLWA